MANTTGYGYLLGPAPQFFDANGKPLAGGKLFVYIAGTTTTAVTYSDFNRTENTSPVILNDLGTCMLIVQSAILYKIVLYDRKGNLLITRDNVSASSEKHIIYTAANKVESSDSTVDVTATTDTDTGIITYDLSIKGEIDRATEAEKGLADAIETEKNRAEEAERTLSESISEKAGTASPLMDGTASVGNSLKYAREDHVHPSDTSREDIANKTTVVLGTSDSKYPTDKAVAEFVNSSIATNTANYISNNGKPFTSVEQLNAYSGPVTNNDYAFVTGTDSEGNTYYDRYKATVSGETVTWALEYRLNNSSFTAAQWSAINSGITSVLVAKIHDHSNKDVLDGITSTDVANWNSKMDRQTVGNVSEPVYLENGIAKVATNVATKDELATKQDILTAGNNITIDSNTISSNQVFVATYGTTKYAEVKDAYDAGKICTVRRNNRYYYLTNIDTNFIWFVAPVPNPNIDSLKLTSTDKWENYSPLLQTHLTFDAEPKAGSNNPVTSDGIKTALDLKANASDLTAHTGDTTVHITEAERNAWNAKQSALTFDTTPTSGSTNPVTSEGIKTALDLKANASDLTAHTGNTTVHITEAERKAWNAKASTSVATTSANGLMSKTDKAKLDGISSGANKADVSYASKKLTKTINGKTTDVVAASTIISDTNTFGNFAAVTDVTVSNIKFHTYWKVAPTSSNQVYGFAVHPNNGKLYRVYNNKGTYSVYSYDTDTNTTYSFDGTYDSSTNKAATVSSITSRIATAKTELTAAIDSEADARESADTTLKSNIDMVDAKGIVINEIDGENVICFE